MSAFAAVVGDVMMLGVALDYLRIETPWTELQLLVGSLLGLLLIPLYYLGYRALVQTYPFWQRTLFLFLAGIVAGCGALTHGLTGLDIHQALSSGALTRPPLQAFAEPSLLTMCAALSAIACLAASVIIVVTDAQAATKPMRPIPFANPVLGTIVLTAASVPLGTAGEFLGPAAPNIAHFVFFVVCRHTIASRTRQRQ